MAGQIRSYISYITVDSEESYIERIRHMIDNLDDTNKEILTGELNKKLNEISIMKQFQKPREVVEEPVYATYQPEEVFTKVKSFEDEINEMINDYLNSQSDTSTGRSTFKSVILPPIYISAFNLMKIYSYNPTLLRKMATTNRRSKVMVKTNGVNMPSLPIYDE